MLTLRRFEALAGSYGADLRRWPEELREPAQRLLDASGEARAVLAAARALDAAIESEGRRRDAALQASGEPEAALARLRATVAARIEAETVRQRRSRIGRMLDGWRFHAFPPALRWMGMATGGGVAIAAGLLIGVSDASAPRSDALLSMLQPAPIHILAN